jgi:hypothetical protein
MGLEVAHAPTTTYPCIRCPRPVLRDGMGRGGVIDCERGSVRPSGRKSVCHVMTQRPATGRPASRPQPVAHSLHLINASNLVERGQPVQWRASRLKRSRVP